MNKKQFEGKLNQLQGNVKINLGKAVHSESLEASGFKDKVQGKLQEEVGNIEEEFEKNTLAFNAQKDRVKAKLNEIESDLQQKVSDISQNFEQKLNQ